MVRFEVIEGDRYIKVVELVEFAFLPEARLLTGSVQDPGSDRDDQAGILRDAHEVVGLDESGFRVLPSDPRFGCSRLTRLRIPNGLKAERELPVRDRPSDPALERHPTIEFFVHRAEVVLIAIATAVLRAVHRGIRISNQAIHIPAVHRVDRDPDARRDLHRPTVEDPLFAAGRTTA
jgi:hypothetical protein